MKLITLNIWGGQVYEPLLDFIKEQANDTDIFCFQEVMDSTTSRFSNKSKTDIYKDLKKILNNYNSFLATPILSRFDLEENVDFEMTVGQATFVKKEIKVLEEKTIFVHKESGPVSKDDIKRETKRYLEVPRNMHCLTLEANGKKLLVGNLHGFWLPKSKGDSPQRIKQSKIINTTFDAFQGPKILCGDFNLKPDTRSVRLLENSLRNLIVEYNIQSTRSNLHTRKEKIADYIMISPEVKLKDFEVMDRHVSDHLPLMIDFSV